VDRHEIWDSLKWNAVPSGPTAFLHYLDFEFDLRYVLVVTCQVYHGSTWNRLNQGLQRRKFTVGMHHHDMETTLKIVLIDLLESLEYLRYSSVREVVDSHERYLATERQEERNLVLKNMSDVINTSLWSFINSLGSFT
jgi:hypothetical protein